MSVGMGFLYGIKDVGCWMAYPPIDKETIQKYKFEIKNNLRTSLE